MHHASRQTQHTRTTRCLQSTGLQWLWNYSVGPEYISIRSCHAFLTHAGRVGYPKSDTSLYPFLSLRSPARTISQCERGALPHNPGVLVLIPPDVTALAFPPLDDRLSHACPRRSYVQFRDSPKRTGSRCWYTVTHSHSNSSGYHSTCILGTSNDLPPATMRLPTLAPASG